MCHYRPSGLSEVKSSSDRRDSIIFRISFKDVHNYINKQEVNNKKTNKERSQFKKNKIGSWHTRTILGRMHKNNRTYTICVIKGMDTI